MAESENTESENILTKLQDVLMYLIPQLNKFPRDQKFVLGGRIETKLLEVQECCLRAYQRTPQVCKCASKTLPTANERQSMRMADGTRLEQPFCPWP